MRFLLATILLLFAASALAAPGAQAPVDAARGEAVADATSWWVPLWRSADGRVLAGQPQATTQPPWQLRPTAGTADETGNRLLNLSGAPARSVGVVLDTPQRLYSALRLHSVDQPVATSAGCSPLLADCVRPYQTWRGGSLLGGYRGDALLIDLGLDWLRHNPDASGMYLLVPMTGQSRLLGIPSSMVDSINRIEANGRLQLGEGDTYLNMGASVGRVNLRPGQVQMLSPLSRALPGFLVSAERIDQTEISLGLSTGAVSGVLVGRMMQPQGAAALGNLSGSQPWSALDLGITVRLPWEGELRLGAQNLWSSDEDGNRPVSEPDPIRGRVPYIRYHQNL